MTRINKVIAFAFLLIFAAAGFAADVPPDVLVRNTTAEVVAMIKQDKELQAGDRKKLLEVAEAKILPHFDFARMTRLAVGKSWLRATPQQREVLVREFRTLLVRTYTTAFTVYKEQTMEVKPLTLQPGETDVTVRTQVNQPGGQPISINLSMYKTPEGWKVYDVVAEGVSLITTYRNSFTEEIRKSGIEGLIKTLSEKNQGAVSEAASPVAAKTSQKGSSK